MGRNIKKEFLMPKVNDPSQPLLSRDSGDKTSDSVSDAVADGFFPIMRNPNRYSQLSSVQKQQFEDLYRSVKDKFAVEPTFQQPSRKLSNHPRIKFTIDGNTFKLKYDLQSQTAFITGDKQSVLNLLEKDVALFSQLSPELKSDQDICLDAIRINSSNSRFISDGSIINHVSDSLKSNDSFMLKAVEHNPNVLNHVPVLKSNKAFMLQAVQKAASVYNLASDDLKKDIDFAIAYVDSSYKGVSPSFYVDMDNEIASELHVELRGNTVIKQVQQAAKLKYKAEFLKHQAAAGN